jgi:iron complex outermembrane receptor protein
MAQASAAAVGVALLGGGQHAAAADGDPTVVSEVTITAKRDDLYNVLPDRKTSSVFDLPLTLEQTPRSITLIEAPIISLYGIRNVDDFVKITPGTFTGNYFGVPGELTVRGDLADNFFRGFRRIENPGNFPTTVGAADYVEVIKGPPPIAYGGGKVGGILNFVPKGPADMNGSLISHPEGQISATLGTYGKRLGDLEGGLPFQIAGMPSGVYASVQGEDSDSYFRGIYQNNVLAQVSARTEPSPMLAVEYGGMFQWSDLNQNLGWNRITQTLIDSDGKKYLAGRPGLNLDTNHDGVLEPSEVNPYQLDQYAFANPFPYYALSPNQRAAFALDPATVGDTSISHRTILAEPSDYARSYVYTAYLDFIYQIAPGWTVKNQSFYDQLLHSKYSSYGFTANYHDHVFENKTSVSGQYSAAPWLDLDPVGGFSARAAWGRERQAQDIYQSIDRRDLSFGATANDRFENALDGTGQMPFNWDQDGGYTDFGLFGVLDATLFKRLSAIVGARWDDYHVHVIGTDFFGNYGHAKDSKSAFSYNASASFKVIPSFNVYTTYASSQFVQLGQGGMVGWPNVASRNWMQPSKLWEVGVKGYLLDGRLYLNALRYIQQRSSYDIQANQFDRYRSDGEELEAHYAMSKRLSFIGTATWQHTVLLNTPFFNAVPPGVLGLDPALTYGGKFVAAGGSIGFYGPSETPDPATVFGLTATYTDPMGWGVSFGATHVSAMWAGYAEAVRLPSYTVAHGALFYNHGPWSLQVNANNLFDEHYFLPQSLFNDALVLPSEGRTVEATLRRRF